MKLRLHLTATIDVDVLHPTFAELLDPRIPTPKLEPDHEMGAEETRVWMALEGYLGMLIAERRRHGVEPIWEVGAVESICRVCGCTDDAACDGGCSWTEADLCSACVGKAVPA